MNSSGNHHDYSEQLWLYAIGALDGPDLREFERHLAQCAACQKELVEARATTAKLIYATSPVEPPIGLRAKVENRLNAATRQRSYRVPARASWWPRLAAGFGVAALLLAFAGWYKALNLNEQILSLQSQVRDMESQLSRQTAQLAMFRSPASEVLLLAGQAAATTAKGKMVWDPATGTGVFLAAGLPAIAQDKSYQLWVIADGKPISAGVFSVNSKGGAEIEVEHIPGSASISAFAVTLEPAGGLPQPSGDMYLLGAPPKS